MEANDVLLSLALRGAGIELGAAQREKLCSSLGRLGIAMTKGGKVLQAAPTIAANVPTLGAFVTIEIARDGATRVEIGPR